RHGAGRVQPPGVGHAAPAPGRLRLPGPEPAVEPDRGGERVAAAGARRHGGAPGPAAGPGRPVRRGPRRVRRAVPGRAVRRPAAAGGDRPGAGRPAAAGAGRRTDRRVGLAHRRGGAATAAVQGGRWGRRRAGHPRGAARGLGGPGGGPARPRRRRHLWPAGRGRRTAQQAGRRTVSGWRPALRVARREARRAKGRSALVVAMIALPVAALTSGAVVYDTFRLSPAETADRQMGAAQALVIWPSSGQVRQLPTDLGYAQSDSAAPGQRSTEAATQQLLALLPAGSTAVRDQLGTLTVRTASGVGTLDARMLDYADPLARGILRPLSGRTPAAADEVALTPRAASRLGTGVGDTIRLTNGRAFRVVATVEEPGDLRASVIVLRSCALPPGALHAAGEPGSAIDSPR